MDIGSVNLSMDIDDIYEGRRPSLRAGWGAGDVLRATAPWKKSENYNQGISEYWRKNTSSEESVELANLLRSLRKVAGHIGENIGEIEWTGMSSRYRDVISLDPTYVMGNYPVPHSKVDYLVGCVIHEAFHRKEWSYFVWEKIEELSKDEKIREKVIIHKIVYAGEDIYIDHLPEQSILGSYVKKSRAAVVGNGFNGSKIEGITVDELLYLWWLKAIEQRGVDRIKPQYKESLMILDSILPELKEVPLKSRHVTDRCEMRAHLYFDIWKKIKGLVSSWSIEEKALLWVPETKGKVKKRRTKTPISLSLIDKIEVNLASDSSDITSIIHSIVGEDNEDVIPTSIWDFNIPAHPVIDHVMVARLKAIFQNYSDRKCLVNHGLTSGKVDKRRLYRAPISGKCFMDKQFIPEMSWNITLLMDASGSMGGSKWRLVENTVANIHKAFIGFNNHLNAYAYFELDNTCMLSKLISGNTLLSVPPNGHTASGQAIIATTYLMSKDKGRRIIIHVTDGESNCGCNVQYGIDYCKAQDVDLITLACGYKDRDTMSNQYGKSIQFLDHFNQLPNAIESLLRWIMVYKNRKNSYSFQTDLSCVH
ncbi:MAG: vWA domain-containing protein [Thermodesulfobacteriota bacterium]|nr:vWA domain-containing protein [Thermodesulfobacteriota bacterium]